MDVVRVALDMFPALANLPTGGRHEPSRVVIANDRVQVWIVRRDGGGTTEPEVAFESDALSVEGNRIAGYNILTPDGNILAVRAGGCGCGSKLKTFDPFAGATRTFAKI